MQPEHEVLHCREKIHALNRAFLDLLARCPTSGSEALGLPSAVAAGIAAVDVTRRKRLAAMPFLLAGIRPDHGHSSCGYVNESGPGVDNWARESQVYAASLLTFLWTSMHSADPDSVLILGRRDKRQSWLSGLSMEDIPAHSLQAPGILIARLSHCASFWHALVRAGREGEVDLPRLWMIPLVAGEATEEFR